METPGMTQSPPPLMGPHRVVSDDAMRRWRKRRRRLRRRLRRTGDVALVGLALVAIVFAVHRRHTTTHAATTTTAKAGTLNAIFPPANDVIIQGCVYSNFFVHGGLYIYNHANQTQNYYVEVIFKNGPRKYAQAVAKTENLAPKAHVVISAFAAARAAAPKHLTCTIDSIERFGGAPPTSRLSTP
jgi:hypothetical protein